MRSERSECAKCPSQIRQNFCSSFLSFKQRWVNFSIINCRRQSCTEASLIDSFKCARARLQIGNSVSASGLGVGNFRFSPAQNAQSRIRSGSFRTSLRTRAALGASCYRSCGRAEIETKDGYQRAKESVIGATEVFLFLTCCYIRYNELYGANFTALARSRYYTPRSRGR